MKKQLSNNLDKCLIEAHLTELPKKYDGKKPFTDCIIKVVKNGSIEQYVLGRYDESGIKNVRPIKVWDAMLITEIVEVYPFDDNGADDFDIPFTRTELTAKIKEIDNSFDLRTLRTKADIDIYRLYSKMAATATKNDDNNVESDSKEE